MARQTRSERRARREAQARSAAAIPQPAGPAPPPLRPSADATSAERVRRAFPGSGSKRFVGESWGELRKVEWPGQNQVIQGTAVVLLCCIIIGTFLYASDQVFRRLVENVFLGQ